MAARSSGCGSGASTTWKEARARGRVERSARAARGASATSITVNLGLGDFPYVVEPVAGLVARLRILAPRIQRLALVRPLLAAVVARDDLVRGRRRAGAGDEVRRPVGRALAVAGRLPAPADVAVERVERHAGRIDQDAADGLGRIRRRRGA